MHQIVQLLLGTVCEEPQKTTPKNCTNSTKEFSEQFKGTYPVKQGLSGKSHQKVHPRVRKIFVAQILATGKYGCTEVRVYPAECGEQLGRDPKKLVLMTFWVERTFWDSSLLVSLTLCQRFSNMPSVK